MATLGKERLEYEVKRSFEILIGRYAGCAVTEKVHDDNGR